ncbi:protein), partial Hydra magnipapillata [Nesidiocoris tenuis]|uniref:Protein, partial Hydra magnipapillata n=1 Tax=Nesidiocoris tenuis TaxID=355587 RepID=A0ABN7A9K9_9HEMI
METGNEEPMEVICGASRNSYSFIYDNYIYRLNKFTNQRAYVSCRMEHCNGAGVGIKGSSRTEIYNFQPTREHNHPPEEKTIRILEVKEFVREQAKLTNLSSKEIHESVLQLFHCDDLSRASVDGLVKRARESTPEKGKRKLTENRHAVRKKIRTNSKFANSEWHDSADSSDGSTSQQPTDNARQREAKRELSDDDPDQIEGNLEKSLIQIYNNTHAEENVFQLLSLPDLSKIDQNNDNLFSDENIDIFRSAAKLCNFTKAKAAELATLVDRRGQKFDQVKSTLVDYICNLLRSAGFEFLRQFVSAGVRCALEQEESVDRWRRPVWSEEEIAICEEEIAVGPLAIAILAISAETYTITSDLLGLPSPHVARKWATRPDGAPGFAEQSIAAICKAVRCRKSATLAVCLSVLDVQLAPDVELIDDRFTGQVDLGYGQISSADVTPAARRALVFHVGALNDKWRFPLGYVLADNLTPAVRANLIGQYATKLEFCGVKCVALALDGSATDGQILDEFGLYSDNDLPKNAFTLGEAKEKIRISPFVDILDLMKSMKFLLFEKKVFLTTSNEKIEWSHIEFVERILKSDVEIEFSGYHADWNLLKESRKRSENTLWPFDKFLLEAMEILTENDDLVELEGAIPTVDFVSSMVQITSIFTRFEFQNFRSKEFLQNVDKWIHFFANFKFADGQFVRDSDRRMPLMNLCMNLSSLKLVLSRVGASLTSNRLNLRDLRNFVFSVNKEFGPLPKAREFQDFFLRTVQPIKKSRRAAAKNRQNFLDFDLTFYAVKVFNYEPFRSSCDRVDEYFARKTVDLWLDNTDCGDCYRIVALSVDTVMYRNIFHIFRLVEIELCASSEIPSEFEKFFDPLANRILNSAPFDGFLRHSHLFDTVEFGEICHFTILVKSLVEIYARVKCLYQTSEIKAGINDFGISCFKHVASRSWA